MTRRVVLCALILCALPLTAAAQQGVGSGTVQIMPGRPAGNPTSAVMPQPQPQPTPRPPSAEIDRGDRDQAAGADEAKPIAHPKGSPAQSLFFWLFALFTVGGSIMVITRRNAVSAVMFLVATFLGLSALYVMLYAHFLAVIQVLVYAGAIMVLFVFVIMILNKEEEEPWALRSGLFGKILAGGALIYLLYRVVGVLWTAPARIPEAAFISEDYGTTAAVGKTLFSSYLFPFEAVSIVLLIAVVGALVLAHPAHPNVGEEEQPKEGQ